MSSDSPVTLQTFLKILGIAHKGKFVISPDSIVYRYTNNIEEETDLILSQEEMGNLVMDWVSENMLDSILTGSGIYRWSEQVTTYWLCEFMYIVDPGNGIHSLILDFWEHRQED